MQGTYYLQVNRLGFNEWVGILDSSPRFKDLILFLDEPNHTLKKIKKILRAVIGDHVSSLP